MKTLLTMALVGLVSGVGFADVSKDDVKKLLAAGLSENVVLGYVRQHAPMAKLSPEDIADLKNAGASDSLLKALLEAGAAQAPPPSQPYTAPDSTSSYTYVYPDYEYYPYSSYYAYPYYPYYCAPGAFFSFRVAPRNHFFFPSHSFNHGFSNHGFSGFHSSGNHSHHR